MSSLSIRLLVLDFDGVVLESNDLKTAAFAVVFARFPEHTAPMMAYHHAHVSESRFSKFRHLVFERLGQPGNEAMVKEIADAFSAEMRARLRDCAMVPGAMALLEEWHVRLPIAVASMTPQEELLDVIADRGLGRYFGQVFGCPPWSKPDAVREAIRHAGVTPGETLVVGDSMSDWQASRETGTAFLGRDSGLPLPADDIEVVPDLHAVAAYLRPRVLNHVC